MPTLTCFLGTPELAVAYGGITLSPADAERLRRSPTLAGRRDWQVSRVLKQQADAPVLSLSHSKGCAAALCGEADIRAGVDLEALRRRDFRALAAWVCSEAEYGYLQRRHWQAEDFYRLWCVKEALLKAAGLGFPADMAGVGYRFCGLEICGLYAAGQGGWHGVTAILPGFAAACVWQGENVRLQWRFAGAWNESCLSGGVLL